MIAAATRYKYSSNSITELLNIWGFAVAIDISQSAASINRSCPLNIPVPPGDSTFFYTSNLPFFRLNINLSLSILDPQINPQTLGFANTNFTNFATSFIDCSILYGLSSSSAIRAYTGGLLSSQILAEDNGEYPLYDKATGFFKYPTATPNHLPSLNAIYILLLREHNRMAKYYSNLYPNATDEQLFQKSRRWVISVVQKITFEQYIPVLTGAPLSNYTGYNQSTNPCMSLYASFVGMRYGHSSTSSFITRLESDGMTPCSSGPISLYEATFNVACFSESGGGGIESILRGMIAELDKTAGLNLVDDLRNRLLNVNNFTDNQPNDLLAIDVQRCRDVGMVRIQFEFLQLLYIF